MGAPTPLVLLPLWCSYPLGCSYPLVLLRWVLLPLGCSYPIGCSYPLRFVFVLVDVSLLMGGLTFCTVASNTFPQTMPGISAVPRERRRSKGSACKPSMMKTSLARPNTKTARRAFATPRKSRCKMMSGRATDAMKAPSCSGSRTVSTLATTRWQPRVRVFSKIRAKDRDAISSATMCELGYAERAARARLGLD